LFRTTGWISSVGATPHDVPVEASIIMGIWILWLLKMW